MLSVLIRNAKVALLLTGSAILLFACEGQSEAPDRAAEAAMMTEYSENLSIVMSENGRRSYFFETPLLEGYRLGAEPYREFRRGVRMTTYQDDSLSTVDAVLTANYAIYYENRELWEAKGDVVVKKYDGTEVYTQQLFWNARTKKVYSNVDTKLIKGNNVTVGERFESDDEFRDWRFRYQKSRMEVDVTPSERDTTATAEAVGPVEPVEPAPVTEGDRNARRHPETPPIRPRNERTTRPRPAATLPASAGADRESMELSVEREASIDILPEEELNETAAPRRRPARTEAQPPAATAPRSRAATAPARQPQRETAAPQRAAESPNE